jgi:hypothetical protein
MRSPNDALVEVSSTFSNLGVSRYRQRCRITSPQRVMAYHAESRMRHSHADANSFDIVAEAEAITAEASALALV